jgi:hypothetical protein
MTVDPTWSCKSPPPLTYEEQASIFFFKKWKKEQHEIDKYLKGYHLVLSIQHILEEERENSETSHSSYARMAYLSDANSEAEKNNKRFLFGSPIPYNPFYDDRKKENCSLNRCYSTWKNCCRSRVEIPQFGQH